MTVVARVVREDRIHELHLHGGEYELRLYMREPDADRLLSPSEAMQWIDTVKKVGGAVAASHSSLTPRTAALRKDHT